jgi:hypothetical protein
MPALNDRSVRSLEHLENSASTARVLNLRQVAVRHSRKPEYSEQPFFHHPALNKAIVLKHRLRANEMDEFQGYRQTATKILIPIETGDLRMGARYLFIGQNNFREIMFQAFGIAMTDDDQDTRTLRLLDEIPTLDPFLLREQLRRNEIIAAPCYFDISEADMNRMSTFAQGEIQKLVEMSFGKDPLVLAHAGKLARKILTNANDAQLEPLRLTMQLSPSQYQEGIFCWKAFLYYKWRLTTVLPAISKVIGSIGAIKPKGAMNNEDTAYVTGAKENIRKAVIAACRSVKETLGVYDTAYEGLTQRGDPVGFRDFLLKAPRLFDDLGRRLGAVDHVVSFWRFRFPEGSKVTVTPEELIDIFQDFENSLSFDRDKQPI